MTPIVTLDEVRQFCRIDGTHDDALLAILIQAAGEAVADMTGGLVPDVDVPARVKLAVLSHVSVAYDNHDQIDMPLAAARLLGPLRKLDV